MLCSFAAIEDDKLKPLQELENDLGRTLLAFSCHEAKPAELTPDQLEKIKKLEQRLGLVVVAI